MYDSEEEDQFPEFKRARDQEAIQVRKRDRLKLFAIRREELLPLKKDPPVASLQLASLIASCYQESYEGVQFAELMGELGSGEAGLVHHGLIGIRKQLSMGQLIQAAIDVALVPQLVCYVRQQQYPQLRLEASWCLCNIASGNSQQCKAVVDEGAIPVLIGLLQDEQESEGNKEHAVWGLGNIASDSAEYRDAILREGGIKAIVKAMTRMLSPSTLAHACWALSTLCRGHPRPRYAIIAEAMPVLCLFAASGLLEDQDILCDVLWAISQQCELTRERMKLVVQFGLLRKIRGMMAEGGLGMCLLLPCVRILSNLSFGDVGFNEEMAIREDLMEVVQGHVRCGKLAVRKELCLLLSNIVIGKPSYVLRFIEKANLTHQLLAMFEHDVPAIRREVGFVFSNLCHSASSPTARRQLLQLFSQHHILAYFIAQLKQTDYNQLKATLSCLHVILQFGKSLNGESNIIVQMLGAEGARELEHLQHHERYQIYELVSRILQEHFQLFEQDSST